MAQVLAFVPDLLFGSSVVEALRSGGHTVELVAEISEESVRTADVLVVDLTVDPKARVQLVTSLPRIPTVAFYAHVEGEVRTLARAAGIEVVVPRSRMARDASALVSRAAEAS